MKNIYGPIIKFIGKWIYRTKFTAPPIYIGGCGRSGTTLLLSVLSSHKSIFACPRELNLFENAIIDGDTVKLPKFYRLYRTFLTTRIPRTANRYCEKSPSNIHHVELIEKIHGDNFRFIQVIRDGRDVVLSRHPRNRELFWVEPERWIKDVRKGLTYRNHPRVLTIRYEDLVLNFSKVVEKICGFLEIELSGEILNWHGYARVRENRALFSEISEITPASIGKWKNTKEAERAGLLSEDPEGRRLLQSYGYLDPE